jgi:hypothetical protein
MSTKTLLKKSHRFNKKWLANDFFLCCTNDVLIVIDETTALTKGNHMSENATAYTKEKLLEMLAEINAQKKQIAAQAQAIKYTEKRRTFYGDLLDEIDGEGRGTSTQNAWNRGGFTPQIEWLGICKNLGIELVTLKQAVDHAYKGEVGNVKKAK